MFFKEKEESTFNENKIVDNLRTLSIDMIHEANSGHPGICLDAAPILYTLYAKHLRFNPKDPNWLNRDRFIMSAGHGSALLYSTLYMAGYDISLDDLKKFRTINSKTPGHPEYNKTPGVEMTTGPLGQGLASSVGIALGEAYLRSYYQKKNIKPLDYYTYVLCSDGDLMEGISYEALSLAGTLKLNKLIVLYDNNKISLDGKTENTFNIDVEKYFQSLNWNCIRIDGNDVNSIDSALSKAKQSLLPVVIICDTTIGKYSKLEGTKEVHGTPLTIEDIRDIKNRFGIRDIPFTVSSDVVEEFRNKITERCQKEYDIWQKDYDKLPDDVKKELEKISNHDLSLENENINYELNENDFESLRVSSSKVLNSLSEQFPLFIGGSADLATSTLTTLKNSSSFSHDNYTGKNINYGVREHAMGAIMNGISLSGIRNFSSTYLAFSDYLKPAIRLACQMNLPNIYIFTHDSITVGKDGATHQPVEQLIGLRSIPNLEVFRPADTNEIIGTYKVIAAKKNGPSVIILGRNTTKIKTSTSITEVKKGAYIVKKENKNISAIIISSGEELDLALDVAENLDQKGYDIRVVSMPSIELFKKQKDFYRNEILPFGTKVFVIEASSSYSWYQFVYNEKYLITIDEFGLSGDKNDVMEEFSYTKDKISERIENILK